MLFKLLISAVLSLSVHAYDPSNTHIVIFKSDGLNAWSDSLFASHIQRVFGPQQIMIDSTGSLSHPFINKYSFGYAAEMTPSQVKIASSLPEVAAISPDALVNVSQSDNWNLRRIGSRDYHDSKTYDPPVNGGYGIKAYIVDTGVEAEHQELKGRVKGGVNLLLESDTDMNGHGTHVASIVGGRTVGVSQWVTIVPVKVLDRLGSGYTRVIIQGLEWILNNHEKSDKVTGVVNMSLGGGKNAALEEAARILVNNGIPVVVAAGNENQDACLSSPAACEACITVAAADSYDRPASFSNYGSCVDIFAPGVSINGAFIGGNYRYLSGTSMASPHVAGVIANMLSFNSYKSYNIQPLIKAIGTKGVISDYFTPSPINLYQDKFLVSGRGSSGTFSGGNGFKVATFVLIPFLIIFMLGFFTLLYLSRSKVQEKFQQLRSKATANSYAPISSENERLYAHEG